MCSYSARGLAGRGVPDGWVRAGGTGLALQFGHRFSDDLYFFRPEAFDPDRLAGSLSAIGRTVIQARSEDTLHTFVDDLRICFLRADPPLLSPGAAYRGLTVADAGDIAVMKVSAIGGLGSRKDFIDLYFYLRTGGTLSGIFTLLERRFARLDYNEYHLLKSLAFFDDGEAEPMPRMIRSVDWAEIRSGIEA